jgi:hypothetical protein
LLLHGRLSTKPPKEVGHGQRSKIEL